MEDDVAGMICEALFTGCTVQNNTSLDFGAGVLITVGLHSHLA